MTKDQFINNLRADFNQSKPLSERQLEIYSDKLNRFTHKQLQQIYDHLLAIYDRQGLPRLAAIFAAANEIGVDESRRTTPGVHEWTPTDCKLCKGEGRIQMVWSSMYIHAERESLEETRLERIFAYSDCGDYKLASGEHFVSARCACPAGEASATLPKAWPQWRGDAPTVKRRHPLKISGMIRPI